MEIGSPVKAVPVRYRLRVLTHRAGAVRTPTPAAVRHRHPRCLRRSRKAITVTTTQVARSGGTAAAGANRPVPAVRPVPCINTRLRGAAAEHRPAAVTRTATAPLPAAAVRHRTAW